MTLLQTVYYQSVDLVYRAQDTTTGTAPGPIQFDKAGHALDAENKEPCYT